MAAPALVVMQLLWQMGIQLQHAVSQLCAGAMKFDGCKAALLDMEAMLAQAAMLDRALARYTVSVGAAFNNFINLSMTTDKSSVCGLGLHSSIVGLPNNKAAIMPPQAPLFLVA